jgi:hypothetical protein
MNARESQRTGRLRLRHLLEVTEAKGEEMAAERPRFQRLAREDAAPRVVSSFNLFQTPEPLADRLAGMFDTFGRTLEPSAGLGRLYNAARSISRSFPIVLVEHSPECCGELYRATDGDSLSELVQADFLACGSDRLGLFDSILMNPPFKMGTDCKHVLHALTLLAPGGRLVSLCANGPKQRAKLQPIASQWIELPAGSFKAEGTGVNVAIVAIDR